MSHMKRHVALRIGFVRRCRFQRGYLLVLRVPSYPTVHLVENSKTKAMKEKYLMEEK